MMGSVDEEQAVQTEPKELWDYAGRQKKALWVVYGPSVAAFTYCEQPQTVCSGCALGKAPEPSVMDSVHRGRAIWLEDSTPSWHIMSWPWVAKLLSPSVWITGLRWPFGESSWYSSLQQHEQLSTSYLSSAVYAGSPQSSQQNSWSCSLSS